MLEVSAGCKHKNYTLLEEDKEYEYKIRAFNAGNFTFTSPAVPAKITGAFSYELTEPLNSGRFTIADAENLDYPCNISSPKLLDKNEMQFLDAGLLIFEKSGESRFGSKISFLFDGGTVRLMYWFLFAVREILLKKRHLSELIASGNYLLRYFKN